MDLVVIGEHDLEGTAFLVDDLGAGEDGEAEPLDEGEAEGGGVAVAVADHFERGRALDWAHATLLQPIFHFFTHL